jgi:hypothetical protein
MTSTPAPGLRDRNRGPDPAYRVRAGPVTPECLTGLLAEGSTDASREATENNDGQVNDDVNRRGALKVLGEFWTQVRRRSAA